MSLSDQLSLIEPQPYYTSDEYLLLQSLNNGKFVDDREKDAMITNEQQNANYQENLNNNPDNYVNSHAGTIEDVTHDLGYQLHSGSGEMSGGFAWAALLPLVGQLAGPLIQGFTSLFSKKQQASGVFPPNYRGGFNIDKYFTSHIETLKQTEEALKKSKGSEFWKNVLNVMRNEIYGLVSRYPEFSGISKPVIDKLIDGLVDRMIPSGFTKFISTQKGGKYGGSIIKPVGKFVLDDILNDAAARKFYTRKWKGLTIDDDADLMTGSGAFWDKLKTKLKKFLSTILPASSKLIGTAVDSALQKWGNNMSDSNRGMISGLVEQGVNALGQSMGSGMSSDFTDMITQQVINEPQHDTNPFDEVPIKPDTPAPPKRRTKKTATKKLSTKVGGKKKKFTVELL